MLCFVNSKETAHRLNKLFELNGVKSMEYSSSLHSARRKRIQTKFDDPMSKIEVLVCSDVMARGMDLANVDYVLIYEAPKHVTSYIHKIGRTARAGRSGMAITLLEHKQVFFFKKMISTISKSNEDSTTNSRKIKEIKVQTSLVKLKDCLNLKQKKVSSSSSPSMTIKK
jgi:ATP-dependent RNA helicase DDX51/DBP6